MLGGFEDAHATCDTSELEKVFVPRVIELVIHGDLVLSTDADTRDVVHFISNLSMYACIDDSERVVLQEVLNGTTGDGNVVTTCHLFEVVDVEKVL